jgi:hypothetical protein
MQEAGKGKKVGEAKKRKLVEEEKGVGPERDAGPGFFAPGKKLNSLDLMNQIIGCFSSGEYDALKKRLSEQGYLEEGNIKTFFSRRGEVFLSWVLNANSSKPFYFLNENVPKNILQYALKKGDFSALTTYLYTEAVKQDEGEEEYTLDSKALQVEKFKILLGIDEPTIKDFMQESRNRMKTFLTECTEENFAQAEAEYKEEREMPEGPEC